MASRNRHRGTAISFIHVCGRLWTRPLGGYAEFLLPQRHSFRVRINVHGSGRTHDRSPQDVTDSLLTRLMLRWSVGRQVCGLVVSTIAQKPA
jgi:hypothetical protein